MQLKSEHTIILGLYPTFSRLPGKIEFPYIPMNKYYILIPNFVYIFLFLLLFRSFKKFLFQTQSTVSRFPAFRFNLPPMIETFLSTLNIFFLRDLIYTI